MSKNVSSSKMSSKSSLRKKQAESRSTRKFISQYKRIKEEVDKQAEIGSSQDIRI